MLMSCDCYGTVFIIENRRSSGFIGHVLEKSFPEVVSGEVVSGGGVSGDVL